MNGAVQFTLSPHGWRIHKVWDFKNFEFPHKVQRFGKVLMITGRFNRCLKPGFCKRPHELMEI